MEEENRATVHGAWGSAFSYMVELALKLKGIPYEYVVEDLGNKSPLLLKYNLVHKKVPVLVQNGKPIAESLVILEYIDETWTQNGPKFLPQDPYKKAQVRFWVDYIYKQLFDALYSTLKTYGEAQEKFIKEVHDKMHVLELECTSYSFVSSGPSVDQQKMGLLDIVICCLLGILKPKEEVLGIKFMELEKTPLLYPWVTALIDLPLVKETIPPHERWVPFMQCIRQQHLKSSTA
ncbi:glutathione S-transferase U9-like [Ziziphus jujuba]|uniref:Glutathione S-transferase n=1 Tax=Ziziphus jujuba TaxID=326968 RepID=A0A6P4ACX6_ZIZJJ|nr:glutathione S-transferase U9-like [Ziziphus jujuba]